jgi:two-component system NarL family sensor kinase
MSQSQIISFFLVLTTLFSNPVLGQEKTPSKKEITKLAKEANQHMKNGFLEKSLIKSRFVLRHSIALRDNYLIANSYNTIASNYNALSQFDKAIFFYKKGLSYAVKTPNDTIKYKINNNLGNMYSFDKVQYKIGIKYYEKSLEYAKKIADTNKIVLTKLNITWSYFDVDHFNEGLPYLKYINKYHTKFGDPSNLVILNMLNAMYYGHIGENQKALFFFRNSIKLGQSKNLKSDLSIAVQEYASFLLKIKNYKKAYENLLLYNKITDELDNSEKLKEANLAGINLELDEYKRDIDKIENKYKTKEHLLMENHSRNRKISVIVISLLLLIIILLYFFSQNTRLKQKNKLKDIQSKIQQNIINASIDGQETERKKIATFLHDNISALLSTAGLHLSVFTSQNKNTPEEIIKTKTILEEVHDKIRDLSHDLLPTLLTRFGLLYAVEDLCEQNSNSTILFKYSSSISENTRFNHEFEMKLYFIITELLNNITKHSQASQAKITIRQKNENLWIGIYDNGKGFDLDEYKIMEGFGINQVKARIKNMRGKISFYSSSKTGTTAIHLKVPIARES